MARYEEFVGAHQRARALEESIRQRRDRALEEVGEDADAATLEGSRESFRKANQDIANVRRLQDKIKLRALRVSPDFPVRSALDKSRTEQIAQLQQKLGISATENLPPVEREPEWSAESETPEERERQQALQAKADADIASQRRAAGRIGNLNPTGSAEGPEGGSVPNTNPSGGVIPGPRPIEAIPADFAPEAGRTDAPARVTKQERKDVGRRAGERTAVASNPRKGTKRAQTTVAVGESRAEPTDGGKRQQAARNAAYREETGMGATEGAVEAAQVITDRKMAKATEETKKRRKKIIDGGGSAAAAAAIKAPSAEEVGTADPVLAKFTPEFHAANVAKAFEIPVDHLHSFITEHPAFKQMTRPAALQALYSLGNPNRKRGFGGFSAEQGQAEFAKLKEAAKQHSLDRTDRELAASEGRGRTRVARVGQAAIDAALGRSQQGTGQG